MENQWCIDMLTVKDNSTNQGTQLIGNGKIGYVVDNNRPFRMRSIVTVDFAYSPSYKGNVVDGFDSTDVVFFDAPSTSASANDVAINEAVYSRSLDMYTGIIKTCSQIERGGDMFVVTTETFAVRHMPFSTMHTITVEAMQSTAHLNLYHIVKCGNNIRGVEYVHIDLGAVVTRVVTGKGKLMCHRGGEAVLGDVCIACSFDATTFDGDCRGSNAHTLMGFKRCGTIDAPSCYEHIRLNDLVPGKKHVVRILTTQMTSSDSEEPERETNKLHLLLCRDMDRIRKGHVAAWMNVWKHNVTIEPRAESSILERSVLQRVMKGVRRCLYNVWSSVRCEVADTGSCQLIDLDGSAMFNADEFLVPLLTAFRPEVAKSIIDQRHDMLSAAKRLAACRGWNGSMFPSKAVHGDWVDASERDELVADMNRTAIVSLSVWNQFRATRDKSWMIASGYPLLKSNADFFVACLADEVCDPFPDSTGYFASLALLIATEASYDLQILPVDEWITCFHDINNPSGCADLPLALLPLMSEVMQKQNPTLDHKRLIRTCLSSLSDKDETPGGAVMKAWLVGACYEKDACGEFVDAVLRATSLLESTTDPCSCAMFAMMVVTTIGTVRFTGNVTETRFYTERMGLKTSPSCIMPTAWRSVKITGMGSKPSVINNDNIHEFRRS
jgi:hypothetical protein